MMPREKRVMEMVLEHLVTLVSQLGKMRVLMEIKRRRKKKKIMDLETLTRHQVIATNRRK